MNIFTYGSLMDTEIMQHVSGVTKQGTACILNGFQRYQIRGEQYPGIVRKDTGSVEGKIYCNISQEALARLDIFEGEMYRREKVEITVSKEEIPMEAMVYVIKPAYTHCLSDQSWDFETFLKQGKKLFEDHYFGFAELK